MGADELRKAAETLRERAASGASVVEITDGESFTTAYVRGGKFYLDRDRRSVAEPRPGATQVREFHEVISPSVGLALADWLDSEAEWEDVSEGAVSVGRHALKIARLIHGSES